MKTTFTPEIIKELKSFLVERTVDNMSTEDLVAYVTADLDQYYKNMPEVEFLDIAENYWDDGSERSAVLELDDGTILYASQDYEGNGPGAIFGTDKNVKDMFVVYPEEEK